MTSTPAPPRIVAPGSDADVLRETATRARRLWRRRQRPIPSVDASGAPRRSSAPPPEAAAGARTRRGAWSRAALIGLLCFVAQASFGAAPVGQAGARSGPAGVSSLLAGAPPAPPQRGASPSAPPSSPQRRPPQGGSAPPPGGSGQPSAPVDSDQTVTRSRATVTGTPAQLPSAQRPEIRPPTNALLRENPRIYDLTFGVTLATFIPQADAGARTTIAVADAPIVLPFVFRGPYTAVDRTTFSTRLYADGRPLSGGPRGFRIDDSAPLGLTLAVLPVPSVRCQILKAEFTYRTQAWSSRLDDALGAQATWPQEWPDECMEFLKPQAWIESDHPRFAQFVQEVSQGQLRAVPPLLAAKDLIRTVIQRLRVDGNGIARQGAAVTGLDLKGALLAMTDGVGTPHDLVASCVATLRAAGIPARVLIGLDRDEAERWGSSFISWGEFYLPGSGWVPFDPMQMRGSGLNMRNVRERWPWLGSIRNLNQRITMSYAFHPPLSLIAHGFPAIYGWDPRPNRPDLTVNQFITLTSTSRGRGQEVER